MEGPKLKGTVRPFGADWAIIRADNSLELDVRLIVDTDDGALIHVEYRGIDLTQEQLAAAIDVSLPTIVKIEAGQRRPSRQVAELLARCLEVPPEEQAAVMRLARTSLQPSSEPTASLPPLPAAHLPAEFASPIDREQELGQPGRLPTPLTSFVGREREIAVISDLMQAGGLPAGRDRPRARARRGG